MITRGLIDGAISYGRPRSMRAGRPVNPYTPDQDRRLVELRRDGDGFQEIAARLTAEFGVPRNEHSVRVRAIMLAAYDGGPDAEAAE